MAINSISDLNSMIQGNNQLGQLGNMVMNKQLPGGSSLTMSPLSDQRQIGARNKALDVQGQLMQMLLSQYQQQNQPQSWQQQMGQGIGQMNQMGNQQGGWSGKNIGQGIGGLLGLGASAITGGAAAPLFAPIGQALGGLAGSYFDEDPAVAQQRHQQQLNQQYMQQYQPIANEARREFDQRTMPGLQAQLAGMGPGMGRSSALEQLRQQARTNLESKLAAGQAQNLLGFRNADLQQQQLQNQLLGIQNQSQYQQGMLGMRGRELGQQQMQQQGDLATRLLSGGLGQQYENIVTQPESSVNKYIDKAGNLISGGWDFIKNLPNNITEGVGNAMGKTQNPQQPYKGAQSGTWVNTRGGRVRVP